MVELDGSRGNSDAVNRLSLQVLCMARGIMDGSHWPSDIIMAGHVGMIVYGVQYHQNREWWLVN